MNGPIDAEQLGRLLDEHGAALALYATQWTDSPDDCVQEALVELARLRQWLQHHKVTHVAMEATGVYWLPIVEGLEGQFELVVANAHRVKNVPGRKTDACDAEWLARLLRHGLINSSFVRLLKLTAYYQEPKKNMVTFEDRFEAATRRANENLEKLSDD